MIPDPKGVCGKWIIGRVIEVYMGDDKKVRKVKVKAANNVYARPVTKLVVIYPADGYNDY